MTRHIAGVVAGSVLAACAATSEAPVATGDEQRCTVEARIGSSIPATKCHDRPTAEQNKREADQIVDRIRRAPTRSTSSAGAGN